MLILSAEPHDSPSILEALPGKLDIKRHSPIILCPESGWLAMAQICILSILWLKSACLELGLDYSSEELTSSLIFTVWIIPYEY